jgi:hypothetical protein
VVLLGMRSTDPANADSITVDSRLFSAARQTPGRAPYGGVFADEEPPLGQPDDSGCPYI